MGLLSFHADLQYSNALLERIAVALERIAGPELQAEEPRPVEVTTAIGRVDLKGEKRTRLRAIVDAQEEIQDR